MSKQPPAGDWPAIPGYEILGDLGRGGMGVVYRARRLRSRRPVALKLIRDGALAGPQERARFRIEAEAAARVRHPNVVKIYDVGEHQGRLYFSMELADGSLDQHLARRPQPPDQAAALVRTLAAAAQHAHDRHIVHRDLKPANILLVTRDAERSAGSALPAGSRLTGMVPKISDFGLAKRMDSDSTAWTQDGAVLGTAGYMAPEQAAGRVREVGPSVDVYALGAILYELLTGRPPFQADAWPQLVERILHEEPEPPSRLRGELPADLETICLKCLEKDPARRYARAADLADDLGRFLDGTPVAAVPVDDAERLARLAARDGYEIAGEIGRGPRSIVYRALSGPLKQPVALKVFRRGICTQHDWDERLRRASDLWAALAHPQIVPVHRAGWWDGAPYLAIDYVPQGSLADKLTGRPQPVTEALRLVEQLADVVTYLHRQGVVHGNLKPNNILFAPGDVPRVADSFPAGGLFQSPLPAGDADPAGCASLAPELLRGADAEPRPYTDVYGLGVILYELLTGRPPFAGATAAETLEEVLSREPAPPSQFNQQITPNLDGFCLRCLRKNPWRRFTRAYDLVGRLRKFRENAEERPTSDGRWPERSPGREGESRAAF